MAEPQLPASDMVMRVNNQQTLQCTVLPALDRYIVFSRLFKPTEPPSVSVSGKNWKAVTVEMKLKINAQVWANVVF